MPSKIRVLDEGTVNKIAAGEVVERPASVVKELVENSLDAGATSVTVSLEDGGRRLISVRDDGCGMSREDAKLAFERHSTSKISSIDDLLKLSTFGFRGEALSSIAAVSKVTLRTREHTSQEGTEVVIDSGSFERVSSCGCPSGTEIVVEDLFGNLPARRKSLKSRNVELAHCRDVVVNYMLGRAGLAFSFILDGVTDLVHVASEGMNGSLVTVFGPKVADSMVIGDADGDGVRVEVCLGRLEHTRASPSELRVFVNDRPVKSPKVSSTVVGAYGSKLMKDRYPVGVVRLFVDPMLVDVNVHPAKREVRFEDEGKILATVRDCVVKTLEQPDLSYKYDLTKFSESFGPAAGVQSSEIVKAVQSTLKIRQADASSVEHPVIVPLAQVMSTYILAESDGNLLLVDQHAASERIVYESVLRAMDSGKEISQTLLTPLVIHLSPSELKVMEENSETLAKAGFKIEPFGKDAHAMRSIPTVLGVAQGESAFRNILDDVARMAPEKRLGLEVIWRVACHTAIRAGEALSEGQMRQLVSELIRTESPYTCEHGRPTMIVLSPADLEKLFKRRV